MALWTTHVKYIWAKDTRFILDIIQGLLHIKEHRVLSIHQYEVGEVWRCRFAEIEKGENLSSLLWPCLTEAETHSVGGFLVNASYEAAEATANQSLVDQSPFQKRQWVLNACPVSVTCSWAESCKVEQRNGIPANLWEYCVGNSAAIVQVLQQFNLLQLHSSPHSEQWDTSQPSTAFQFIAHVEFYYILYSV